VPSGHDLQESARRASSFSQRYGLQMGVVPSPNCAPSAAARVGVTLLRSGIDVPDEWAHAVVRGEKFEELPVLSVPGMTKSAFDGRALEGSPLGAVAHRMEQRALPVGAKVSVEGKRYTKPVVARHHAIPDVFLSYTKLEKNADRRRLRSLGRPRGR
jgi:hypothetical protein